MDTPMTRIERLDVTAVLDPSPRYAGTIHEDAAARAAGYRAALIPGAFVYGHATRLALQVWGEDWLSRGTATVRFRRPVYHGDALTVSCGPVERGDGGWQGQLTVTLSGSEEVLLDGSLGLSDRPPQPPDDLPVIPPFAPRMVVEPGGIAPGLQLGSPVTTMGEELVRQSLADFHETAPIYTERGLIHSGCLLRRTMSDAMGNLTLPMPMIFAGAEIANVAPAAVGRDYATSARVTEAWEARGKYYFETEEWLIAGGVDVVARHRRRNVYALRR